VLLELGIGAIFAALGGGGMSCSDKAVSRPLYGALVSWWYGGFTDQTAASMAVTLIDSDRNCEAFAQKDEGGWQDDHILYNASLRLRVAVWNSDKASVRIKCDKKGWIEVPVTTYDDYHLAKAMSRWRARQKELKFHRLHSSAANLLDHRINQNYIDMIEMVEKRILNSGADTAPELRAMLPSPDHLEVVKATEEEKQAKLRQKAEEQRLDELAAKYDPMYGGTPKKKKVAPSTTSTSAALRKATRTKSSSSMPHCW
jgi:hypothetical protein